MWWLYTHFFFLIQKTEQMNYLNDINCCFSWCDKNFSISKIRQSALHEQTHLRWLNKVSLLRRTNKLLLRELKSLTASSCLIFYTFATIYFWVLTNHQLFCPTLAQQNLGQYLANLCLRAPATPSPETQCMCSPCVINECNYYNSEEEQCVSMRNRCGTRGKVSRSHTHTHTHTHTLTHSHTHTHTHTHTHSAGCK